MYNIEVTRGFEQDLKKLDRAVASFILEKIDHHKHIITLYRVRHRKDIYKHLG